MEGNNNKIPSHRPQIDTHRIGKENKSTGNWMMKHINAISDFVISLFQPNHTNKLSNSPNPTVRQAQMPEHKGLSNEPYIKAQKTALESVKNEPIKYENKNLENKLYADVKNIAVDHLKLFIKNKLKLEPDVVGLQCTLANEIIHKNQGIRLNVKELEILKNDILNIYSKNSSKIDPDIQKAYNEEKSNNEKKEV